MITFLPSAQNAGRERETHQLWVSGDNEELGEPVDTALFSDCQDQPGNVVICKAQQRSHLKVVLRHFCS